MAVLVQAMVPAAAAGVAFTADPLTGDREAVLVTAVPGLAEPLVSGEAEGEQWRIVAGQRPQPHRPTGVLNGEQAAAVAAVARRLEALFTGPQDVEWALADGTVWVVQARPMTALPAPVAWPAPGSGLWACNFRLGEWLPEPVTPLFADWLLPLFDAGFQAGMRETAGAAVPFPFGLVNGWYYATPNPRLSAIPLAVARSRGRLLRFMLTSVVLPGRRPTWAAASLLRLYRDWQEQLLPDYQRLAATEVDDLDLPGVLALVERVVGTAGQHFWYLVVIGGAAWKVEDALRAFLVRHHLTDIDAAALVGPVTIPGPRAPQAVYSLDWYHPTASEQPTSEPPSAASPRNAQSDVDARALQARCAARLASDPAVQWTEVDLLELARAFARIREEQSAALTLGWPLLRRCARRIGILLAQSGQLQRPEQMFFLTRAELGRATAAGALDDRRQTWSTQRRLTPPLSIGNPPPLLGRRLRQTVGTTDTRPTEGDELVGQPASPGRATGPARIVRDPDDFGKVQPGDVLVAPATAPAWTPLFGRVLAVVTDRGTAAAHASIPGPRIRHSRRGRDPGRDPAPLRRHDDHRRRLPRPCHHHRRMSAGRGPPHRCQLAERLLTARQSAEQKLGSGCCGRAAARGELSTTHQGLVSSAMRCSTRARIWSRMGRTWSRSWPAGSSSIQSS